MEASMRLSAQTSRFQGKVKLVDDLVPIYVDQLDLNNTGALEELFGHNDQPKFMIKYKKR